MDFSVGETICKTTSFKVNIPRSLVTCFDENKGRAAEYGHCNKFQYSQECLRFLGTGSEDLQMY